MTRRLDQSAMDGVVANSITPQEVANIAEDSTGTPWTIDGCTDFVYAVTYLAGAPFFDLTGVKAFVNGDPLMPEDTSTGFAVPHSWNTDQINPDDGWSIVPHTNSVDSILSNLAVGDVVRAYREPTEEPTATDQFPGHEFIVTRYDAVANKWYGVDNTHRGDSAIWEHPLDSTWAEWDYITDFPSHVYISRLETNVPILDDYDGNPKTTGTLGVNGGTTVGDIERRGDADWFKIQLVAGQSYTFYLDTGSPPDSAPFLSDPFLSVFDNNGHFLASDDDGGGNLNSKLPYTAQYTGTYFVGARSALTGGTGTYNLRAAGDITPPIEPQSTLPVAVGGAATISHNFLWSVDPDNTPDQLTYTIIDQPAHGTILDNGVAATSFTQADIDDGRVSYVENGDAVKSDNFTFRVLDPAGNHTDTETFNIAVLDHAGPVVTGGGKMSVPAGGAAPLLNPALDTVSLGNTPDQIAYTLLLPPEHGLILDNGAPATGFTQADIGSHRVQYVASGDGATSDAFIFQATDAAGNHTGPQPFAIQIQGSGDLALSGGGSTGTGGQPDHTFTFDDVSTLPGSGGADAPAPPAADLIDPAGSRALSSDTSAYDAMICWTLSYSSSSGSQG